MYLLTTFIFGLSGFPVTLGQTAPSFCDQPIRAVCDSNSPADSAGTVALKQSILDGAYRLLAKTYSKPNTQSEIQKTCSHTAVKGKPGLQRECVDRFKSLTLFIDQEVHRRLKPEAPLKGIANSIRTRLSEVTQNKQSWFKQFLPTGNEIQDILHSQRIELDIKMTRIVTAREYITDDESLSTYWDKCGIEALEGVHALSNNAFSVVKETPPNPLPGLIPMVVLCNGMLAGVAKPLAIPPQESKSWWESWVDYFQASTPDVPLTQADLNPLEMILAHEFSHHFDSRSYPQAFATVRGNEKYMPELSADALAREVVKLSLKDLKTPKERLSYLRKNYRLFCGAQEGEGHPSGDERIGEHLGLDYHVRELLGCEALEEYGSMKLLDPFEG